MTIVLAAALASGALVGEAAPAQAPETYEGHVTNAPKTREVEGRRRGQARRIAPDLPLNERFPRGRMGCSTH
jgi:hypothetical protein